MNPSLTKEQRRAVELVGRDICVTAGAGSGKTRVLVERFVHLVVSRKVPVQDILTITFTEKAACEMKQRIADLFASLGLGQQRQDIEFAYLSTIDSFCARLLRENALEAEVDPEFTVLEEYESLYLQRTLAEKLLSDWRGSNPEGFNKLLEGLHSSDLAREAVSLLSKIRSTGTTPSDTPIREISHQEIRAVQEKLSHCLEEIDSQKNLLPTAIKQFERLGKTLQALKPLTTIEPSALGGLTQDHIRTLQEVSDIRLSAPEPIKGYLKGLREGLIPEFLGLFFEKTALGAKLALKDFLTELLRLYAEEKTRMSALDFYDLEEKAIKLLLNAPHVREELRQRFRHIFVDEFQDTNNLQKTLLDLLKRDNNLFVVGDVQQSIYGFRDADPEVFQQYKKETSENKGVVIRLDRNFRSRPEIIDLVNHISKGLWGGKGPVDGSELVAASDFLEKGQPSLELILARDEDMDGARRQEASLLARRIQQIVENQEIKITQTRADAHRPVTYGDFALLFRSTTDIKLFERALNELSIPFFVSRGRGLYNTQEVSDLINLLRLLDNPLDEVRLAAILRSPFAGISDESLFWLIYHNRQKNTEDALFSTLHEVHDIPEISPTQKDRVLRFTEEFEGFRGIRGRVSVGYLIKVILQKTGYDIKMLTQPSGRQRYANLQKIAELARGLEKKGLLGLSELFKTLTELRITETKEPEAPTDLEKSDVVKLMTIHAAKGLEFPVVAVADMGRGQINKTRDLLFSKGEGIGFKVIDPVSRKPFRTRGFEKIVEEINTRESQELQRVLYVALTRAREHLILSASMGKGVRGAWLKTLAENLSISLESEDLPKGVSFGSNGYSIRIITSGTFTQQVSYGWKTLCQEDKKRLTKGSKLAVPSQTSLPQIDVLTRTEKTFSPPSKADYIYSVTEIMSFQTCPRGYYLRHKLGMPVLPKDGPSLQGQEDEIRGDLLGSIAHRVLQRYCPSTNGPALQELIREAFEESLGEDPAQEQVARVKRWVEGFYSSTVGMKVLASKRLEREMPFIFNYRGIPIRGKIDLIFSPTGRGWNLLDYKSTSTPDTGVQSYRFQMQLYSLAAEKLFREGPMEAILFFLASREAVPVDLSCQAMKGLEQGLEAFFLAQEGEDYPLRRGPRCQWCDYQDYCQAENIFFSPSYRPAG